MVQGAVLLGVLLRELENLGLHYSFTRQERYFWMATSSFIQTYHHLVLTLSHRHDMSHIAATLASSTVHMNIIFLNSYLNAGKAKYDISDTKRARSVLSGSIWKVYWSKGWWASENGGLYQPGAHQVLVGWNSFRQASVLEKQSTRDLFHLCQNGQIKSSQLLWEQCQRLHGTVQKAFKSEL